MSIDLPLEERTVVVNGQPVTLDPKRLQFNETTLSKFMQDFSVWYDYYSSQAALSESLATKAKNDYEVKYMEKFIEGKREIGSDKAADAFAKVSEEVQTLRTDLEIKDTATKMLKEYVKSLDRAHQMAVNRGYMLRKEMDKLGSGATIYELNNLS